MNMEEVNGVMNLAIEELSMAQILYDAGKYRGSITHSYYAMFDAAKAYIKKHKKHKKILWFLCFLCFQESWNFNGPHILINF